MAIDVTFPTIDFPHRGEFERSEFVNKQETAQDTLADEFTTAIENFQTQANELETNVNNKEANVVEKHDIVVAKEALMSPHYANIDIVAENIGTIVTKIGVDDIHNATPKSTPVDADELAILDSANSFSLKKLTWANLKTTLLTYFGVKISTDGNSILNSAGGTIKNQCTAWVIFDGTTTPPTIRDSYNVSQVIRVSTGVFDCYFENEMDNINYSICGIVQRETATDNRIVHSNTNSISKFTINTLYISNTSGGGTLHNSGTILIQIFGGKN